MRVLVACEFSGIVRDAFRRAGHEAWSCDLLPTEGDPRFHIQGDVLQFVDCDIDLLIAHPPCTYLTNAGVRHLYPDVAGRAGGKAKVNGLERYNEMLKAAEFFNALRAAKASYVAVENPVPHKYAKEKIGNYSQLIQPWQFGHGETKATCLWLKGLPLLQPTRIVPGREPRCRRDAPGPDRWKRRSRTYEGIAAAMAAQWGCLDGETKIQG